MRFMYIVTSPQPNRGPTPALMEAMHKLSDREIKAGRMLDSGGLMPVSMGAQVKVADGKLSVVDGPFVEAKELIGGYAIFELRDKEEAVAAAVEFMQLHREHMPGWEGTCEVRAMAGPGDTGCQAGQVDALAHARCVGPAHPAGGHDGRRRRSRPSHDPRGLAQRTAAPDH